MLILGKVTPEQLIEQKLFRHFHSKFTPNHDVLQKILPDESIEITVIVGTWCTDCHHHVGKFIALMEAKSKLLWKVNYIAVDRKKQDPDGLAAAYEFTKVPTFIIKKEGREVGRIEEKPMVSLEVDLFSIIKRA